MRYRRLARLAMACASLLTLALVLLGGPAGVGAQLADSPWPMYQHDPQHTGRSPYVGPENPAIKWRYEPRWGDLHGVAIGVDGTLYLPSGRLIAVDTTGDERWGEYDIPQFSARSVAAIGGDGTVYIGGRNRDDLNEFYAINPSGRVEWSMPLGKSVEGQVVTSPVIGLDGTIYFGSGDGKLYAVSADGSQVWSFQTGGRISGASPALGHDGTIYVASWDHYLYAVSPDGVEKWRFATGDWIGSSATIGADGTIYVGSHDDKLYAVRPDGSEKWSLKFPDDDHTTTSTPALGLDGTIYVGSFDRMMYAVAPDGTLKWAFHTDGAISSSPVVDGAGTIYVGSWDKTLYAVNPDGTEKWHLNVGGRITQALAMGGDGILYVSIDPTTEEEFLLAVGERRSSFGIKTSASLAGLAGIVAVGGLGLYLTRRRVGAR